MSDILKTFSNALATSALQWRHNGCDSVSNHQPHDCLLNGLFRRRSKKTWKLCVTGLCAGNSPWTGEFPASMARNAENVSIWWRHHGKIVFWLIFPWDLLQSVQPAINHCFREMVIRLINVDSVYWRINASLRDNELNSTLHVIVWPAWDVIPNFVSWWRKSFAKWRTGVGRIYFNSLAPERFWFWMSNFLVNFSPWWLMYLLWNCHQMNVAGFYWW